ncbi:uncharacterized protein I303_108634 [Kwoniella dejecticola CBS 10117]|uniref:Uncharacterized protein n=1 Tax=Kwoniella dejecticola CBS 10117 TaxID=1296121 RepID=A0A1A5ZWV0_9TREE|nr:uncharacterized protein I303_07041 [Kwoniella dejecticola CBS 10117]OBR82282.1 hypothetical protein I303_07041 [Kwoniella dejecticola CBS 10117]
MSKQSSSATRIVQSLLSQNPHLSTQQLYQNATEHLRPVLQPAHVIDKQGRIRMKRVSNMREGRRPWVPMPTAPYPQHPFKSMNFLKRTILASLESQGLIHKARVRRPIETDEERKEAIATAMRLTRKDERTAMRLKDPVPPPRVPKTTVTEYAWKMGNAPPRFDQSQEEEEYASSALTDADRDQHPRRETENAEEAMAKTDMAEFDEFEKDDEEEARDLARRMQLAWESNRGQPLPKAISSERDGPLSVAELESMSTSEGGEEEWSFEMDEGTKRRWEAAVRLEEKFQQSQIVEQQQIEERQQARRAAFKLERMQKKKERQEDELYGRTDAIRAEKKRIEALEAIENYAKQTGEDVSAWYEELGVKEGETLPVNEDKRRKKVGGQGGFGLRRDI